jgi:hypothetical protein
MASSELGVGVGGGARREIYQLLIPKTEVIKNITTLNSLKAWEVRP